MDTREIKHKLRQLKKLELRLRFPGVPSPVQPLLWDSFFDLQEAEGQGKNKSRAKYSLGQLSAMSAEDYELAVAEFLAFLYREVYRYNTISSGGQFDADALLQLKLSFDADADEIKHRFRALAKKHHPDAGGDPREFIALMEAYERLKGK